MVSVQIYGTDKYLDTLDADTTYIKTAGDLGELTQINSSYSWTMKFPKTPNNTQILDGLGMVGSGSRKPYEKIYCNLLDNGYPIVIKGLLNIRETNDDYVIYVQEGFIDFIKDIGNDTVGDALDLSALNHTRNFPTVRDSLDLSLPYAYLIADVNGRYLPIEDNTTNLDSAFMSPYANVKYIFDKIFETYGWTYTLNSQIEASIDDSWMSYPSEIVLDSSGGLSIIDLTASNVDAVFFKDDRRGEKIYKIPYNISTIDNDYITASGTNQYDFTVIETGDYEFNYTSIGTVRLTDPYGNVTAGTYGNLLVINGVTYNRDYTNNNTSGEIQTFQISLNAGDVVSHAIRIPSEIHNGYDVEVEVTSASMEILYISSTGEVSFTQALIKLKITDFVKEIMTRESLTSFVDSENKNITFLTLEERISAEPVDWTDKFVSRKKETYLYQDYAQSNLMKHKYDDDISDYNDGDLPIDNANLPTEKTIYQSFTHSPLNELSPFVDSGTQYKVPRLSMFEVEVREDEATGDLIGKYKFLKDRFFFVRANLVSNNIYIDTNLVEGYPMVNLNGVLFKDIINTRYGDFISMSNDAKVHEIDLALSLSDIHSLDLSKIYYFEQEASYYILNRLRYKTGQKTTGVFLKVFPEQKLQAFSNAFSNAFNI